MKQEHSSYNPEPRLRHAPRRLVRVAGAVLAAVALVSSPKPAFAGGGCGPYDGKDAQGSIVHCPVTIVTPTPTPRPGVNWGYELTEGALITVAVGAYGFYLKRKFFSDPVGTPADSPPIPNVFTP